MTARFCALPLRFARGVLLVALAGFLSVAADRSMAAGLSQASLSSAEVPKHAVPQNSPCPGQPESLAALTRAFAKGRIPRISETTGTWVAIGMFGAAESHGKEVASMNCAGITRGRVFEEVMVATGYSVEMRVVGTPAQAQTLTPDHAGSVTFPFDFGGDSHPIFRCRLTARKTLACLIDVYREGTEFKKMSITP